MVDWAPWAGSFEGTVVEGNTLIADNNMMKVGIAVGGMVSFFKTLFHSSSFDH